jgi:hypothetical protein
MTEQAALSRGIVPAPEGRRLFAVRKSPENPFGGGSDFLAKTDLERQDAKWVQVPGRLRTPYMNVFKTSGVEKVGPLAPKTPKPKST